MKILFGTAFPPQFGGAERLLLELVKYAKSKGHDVVFCTTLGHQSMSGITTHTLPWTRSSFPPKEMVEQLSNAILGAPYREFARIVGIENPDRIFIQNEAQLFKFLPEKFKKKTYVWGMEPPRLVFEPHTLAAIGRPHFRLYGLLMKPLLEPVWKSLNLAGRVAGCSDYSTSLLKDLFGLNAKTMYDWVDTDHFKPAQVEKSQVPLILCATRINPIKRQLLICQALNLVKDIEWQAIFVGNVADKKYYSQVVSFCEKNDLSTRIKFPGPFGDGELIEAYTKAAFTVYAPVCEPFAFMPIEGMACGTPAIGVNEGGVREVIADGKVGLLASATPEDLAGKIRLLLEDGKLRNGMAASARQFVIDNFELKARCQNFLDDIEKTGAG